MALFSSKWSFVCFVLVLLTMANWKHLYDLFHWSHELSSNYFVKTRYGFNEIIHVLQIESNCGVHHACPENSFPIFLSTGAATDNQPKLCVAGKYVIKPRIKDEGRGLNAAVVEPNRFEVTSVRNFDTYLYNKSTEIAEWIDEILENDILIIFTSDEASARLSGETKALFNQLGSGKIQNLQYRSQWFMITQKGEQGFTTYEKITYSKKKSWGETIEFRGCIPRKIPKKKTIADEPLRENKKKVQFCEGKKAEKYKGFCNEPRYEIIMPALLTNKSLVGNPVYGLPIFVFASENIELLISTLDNLIHQPGILVSLVTILYENNASEITSLAKVYGVHSNKTKFGTTFKEKLMQVRELASKQFLNKKYLIVLDTNVIPSPDFLYFLAQIFPILEKDEGVSTISGWSSNCYNHDGNIHLVYRIKSSPKYAALISIQSNNEDFYSDMFAPDVARVQGLEACHLPSVEPSNKIDRPQDLLKDRYFKKLIMLQQLSQILDVNEILNSCSEAAIKNETNIIYVQAQDNKLSKILNCLGIMKNQFGKYEGIVRLFINGKTVLIVTSESSFYKSRPIASI